MASTTPPRRIDRQRRSKIIKAAMQLMEQEGVSAVTHRRAAAAAGVPLGATTYYFNSIGDLMAAALQEIIKQEQVFNERMEAATTNADLALVLAEFICESGDPKQRTGLLTTELVSASLRHEEVRLVTVAWLNEWKDVISPLVGDQVARTALAVVGGLIQQSHLAQEAPSLADVTEIMLRVLDGRP